MYQAQQGQWLTPTEVFKPYYSHVMARYVASVVLGGNGDAPTAISSSNSSRNTDHDEPQPAAAAAAAAESEEAPPPPPLSIIELGGGRGTNALCMMDFLEQTFPHLYERTNYTIVDASPTLIQLQTENLHNSRHASKFHLVHQDLVQVGEGQTNLLLQNNNSGNPAAAEDPQTHYFILGLELLDNLPHCKIRVCNTQVEQAELVRVVDGSHDDHDRADNDSTKNDDGADRRRHPLYNEVFTPLSDPLLQQILQRAPIYKRIRGAAWIPSIACGLLQSMAHQFQNHPCHILLADFDWLPPADTTIPELALSFPAEGQPLVTDMNDVDHACYLLPTDTATDILFPTNFDKLAVFAKHVFHDTSNSSTTAVTTQTQADFLRAYGKAEIEATSSWWTGYSPLIHDFQNCSVLQISSMPKRGI